MNVVLVNPQIPQNTGSISRTCGATKTKLRLVGKIGFDISDKAVRRAGLDYWPYVDIKTHETWEDYVLENKDSKLWLISKFGTREYWDANFSKDDSLVFGSETKGLGKEFLSKYDEAQILRIPMSCEHVRSLNLSNAVSIVLYESLRQISLKSL
ncbi:MAG: tRNA (cytidine(34)-2'-O)-methyltransferase [Bdellovibrionota bacterium]